MTNSFKNTGSIPSRKNSSWLLLAGIGVPVAVAVIALSIVMTRSSQASHAAPPAAVSAPPTAAAPTADAKNSEPMPGDGADKAWNYGGAN